MLAIFNANNPSLKYICFIWQQIMHIFATQETRSHYAILKTSPEAQSFSPEGSIASFRDTYNSYFAA